MATKIQVRRDTSANWASSNPVLSAGEPGYDTTTGVLKIGDGTTAWSALPETVLDSDPRMTSTMSAALADIEFYRPESATVTTTTQLATNSIRGSIFTAGLTTNVTSLAVNVTTAGSGSSIRLGIYELNRSAKSATLVADFGTVASTTTGTKIATGTAPVVLGRMYWVVAVAQGGTAPTVTCCNAHLIGAGGIQPASAAFSSTVVGLQEWAATASGALPSSLTSVAGSTAAIPVVLFMADY